VPANVLINKKPKNVAKKNNNAENPDVFKYYSTSAYLSHS